MAEDGMMVQTLEIKPEMADLSPEKIGQSLAGELGKLLSTAARGLVNLPDKGHWEIVSHSLTRLDRHLILSVVIKKP